MEAGPWGSVGAGWTRVESRRARTFTGERRLIREGKGSSGIGKVPAKTVFTPTRTVQKGECYFGEPRWTGVAGASMISRCDGHQMRAESPMFRERKEGSKVLVTTYLLPKLPELRSLRRFKSNLG